MTKPRRTEPHRIVILNVDRIYAEALRDLAFGIFPAAKIRLGTSLRAVASLPPTGFDVLITGLAAAGEGDALDFLAGHMAGAARRVLVVTAQLDARTLMVLRALSVPGVFDAANEIPAQFASALEAVADGRHYWSRSALQRMQVTRGAGPAMIARLTVLEQLGLSILGDGRDDQTAARDLALSVYTVATVRRDLHRKLGVRHRGELMRVAAENGFVRFTESGTVRPGFALLNADYQLHARKFAIHRARHQPPAAATVPFPPSWEPVHAASA
jgi:DNA-binding NarL/FixJ family response regulator